MLLFIADPKACIKYPKAFEIATSVPYSNKNIDLSNSLFGHLAKKTHFGESRGHAKEAAIKAHRAECERLGKPFNLTDVRVEGIYSHSTFENYMKAGSRFIGWIDDKGYNVKAIDLAVKRYGVEYLKSLEDRGLAPSTIEQAKAFMGKIRGKEIDFKVTKSQEPTKGRTLSERACSFKEENHPDLALIARATGGRRADLERLEIENFKERNGIVYAVEFKGSKGGRDRLSPILPTYQKEVTAFVTEKKRLGEHKAFEKVNSKANIHAYRRLYAQEVYKYGVDHKSWLKEQIKALQGQKHSLPKDYKEEYKCRDGRTFDREALFVASQGLGHSRLDVITNNYFK